MQDVKNQRRGPRRADGQIAARVVGWAATVCLVGLTAGPAVAQSEGPDRLREDFRDWVVNCQTTPANGDIPGQRACELVQQIDHQESGQRVLAFSLRINEIGEPVAVVVAPFGLRLSEGLRVQVGGEQVAQFAFETCLPEGCLAVAPMEAALISSMQGGVEGSVVMVSRQGEALGIPISLLGFTAGLERVRALSGG